MKLHISITLLCSLIACGEYTAPAQTIDIKIGEFSEFTVGGVTFTLSRKFSDSGELQAKNNNADHVKILVTRTDGNPAVPLDVSFLGYQDIVSGWIALEPGTTYNVEVKIWAGGLDLITCPLTEDSCFRAISRFNFGTP